jgi:hypothetical protein
MRQMRPNQSPTIQSRRKVITPIKSMSGCIPLPLMQLLTTYPTGRVMKIKKTTFYSVTQLSHWPISMKGTNLNVQSMSARMMMTLRMNSNIPLKSHSIMMIATMTTPTSNTKQDANINASNLEKRSVDNDMSEDRSISDGNAVFERCQC